MSKIGPKMSKIGRKISEKWSKYYQSPTDKQSPKLVTNVKYKFQNWSKNVKIG